MSVQVVEDLNALMKDPDEIDTNGFQHQRNGHNPYKHLVRVPMLKLMQDAKAKVYFVLHLG